MKSTWWAREVTEYTNEFIPASKYNFSIESFYTPLTLKVTLDSELNSQKIWYGEELFQG